MLITESKGTEELKGKNKKKIWASVYHVRLNAGIQYVAPFSCLSIVQSVSCVLIVREWFVDT